MGGKRKLITTAVAFALATLVSPAALAIPINITFEGVPTAEGGGFNSSNADIAALESQLLAVFDVVDLDTISFEFTNNVGVASSIQAIYFDDAPDGSGLFPGLDFTSVSLTESAGVNYGLDAVAPPQPAANIFGASVAFGVDSQSSPEGVNAAIESLIINVDLLGGYTTNQIASAVEDGSLAIALHMQSIGEDEESDWFRSTTPVDVDIPGGNIIPEPATVSLMGLGLLGIAARRIRRKS